MSPQPVHQQITHSAQDMHSNHRLTSIPWVFFHFLPFLSHSLSFLHKKSGKSLPLISLSGFKHCNIFTGFKPPNMRLSTWGDTHRFEGDPKRGHFQRWYITGSWRHIEYVISVTHPDYSDLSFGMIGDINSPLVHVLQVLTTAKVHFLYIHADMKGHLGRKIFLSYTIQKIVSSRRYS